MSTLLQIDGFQRCLQFGFFPLKNGFRVAMFSIEFNKHWDKIRVNQNICAIMAHFKGEEAT
jgi:hypothetical protein